MAQTAIQTRFNRLQKAIGASRKWLRGATRSKGGLSQSELARRIAKIDDISVAQKTISRFLLKQTGITVDHFLALLSAAPGAADAFEQSLAGDSGPAADRATWGRIATRLSLILTKEDGLLLADALEDLHGLNAIEPTWSGLRRDAKIVRASQEKQAAESPALGKNV